MAARKVTPQLVKDILSSFIVPETPDSLPDKTCEEKESDPSPEKIECLSAPRDRKAFINRVESYTTLNWFAKPVEFSPLVCSRYGWENTGADMLKCVSCKSLLCGQLMTSQNPQVYRECHRKLSESLITAHTELCPWRTNPSPESFFTVVFQSQRETVEELKDGYSQLLEVEAKLPAISFQTLGEIGVDNVSLQSELTPKTDVAPPVCVAVFQDAPVNLPAFCLALFGWRKCQSQAEVIVCERCRRQVGLWNFTSPDTETTVTRDDVPAVVHSPGTEVNGQTHIHGENLDGGEPKAKKLKLSTRESFDPIAEHKIWCPWLNAATDYSLSSSPNLMKSRHSTSLLSSPQSGSPSVKQTVSLNQSQCTSLMDQSLDTSLGSSFNQSESFSTPSSNHKPGQVQIPAWQMVLFLLSLWQPETFAAEFPKLQNSPPVEGMRQIRKILRGWTSPKCRRKFPAEAEASQT